MNADTPTGFYVCGLFSGALCVATVAAQLSMDPVGGESGGRLAVRGLSLVMVPLAGVVTEALWRARPWAYRASLALALVYATTLATAMYAVRHSRMLDDMVMWTIGSAVVVIPMLGYIRALSARIWPRARVALSAPRP